MAEQAGVLALDLVVVLDLPSVGIPRWCTSGTGACGALWPMHPTYAKAGVRVDRAGGHLRCLAALIAQRVVLLLAYEKHDQPDGVDWLIRVALQQARSQCLQLRTRGLIRKRRSPACRMARRQSRTPGGERASERTGHLRLRAAGVLCRLGRV